MAHSPVSYKAVDLHWGAAVVRAVGTAPRINISIQSAILCVGRRS